MAFIGADNQSLWCRSFWYGVDKKYINCVRGNYDGNIGIGTYFVRDQLNMLWKDTVDIQGGLESKIQQLNERLQNQESEHKKLKDRIDTYSSYRTKAIDKMQEKVQAYKQEVTNIINQRFEQVETVRISSESEMEAKIQVFQLEVTNLTQRLEAQISDRSRQTDDIQARLQAQQQEIKNVISQRLESIEVDRTRKIDDLEARLQVQLKEVMEFNKQIDKSILLQPKQNLSKNIASEILVLIQAQEQMKKQKNSVQPEVKTLINEKLQKLISYDATNLFEQIQNKYTNTIEQKACYLSLFISSVDRFDPTKFEQATKLKHTQENIFKIHDKLCQLLEEGNNQQKDKQTNPNNPTDQLDLFMARREAKSQSNDDLGDSDFSSLYDYKD